MSDDRPGEAASDEAHHGRFAYEYVKWQLDGQADRVRSIHARIGVLVGLNSIILGVFAIAAAIVVQDWTTALQILANLALAFFLASTGAAFLVVDLKPWAEGPPPADVMSSGLAFGEPVARSWTMRELVRAHVANAAIIRKMERWTRAAIWCAFADVVLASAVLVVAITL